MTEEVFDREVVPVDLLLTALITVFARYLGATV
jgi:hypothetical protein